jgi:glycosyltransferase involved in cell wall biosynthesis
MRIALMTEPFLPKIDGIVTMLTKTTECLRRRGDDVLIFAPSGGPALLFGAEVVGLPSLPFPLYPELRLALPRASMRNRLIDFAPDIIHVFEPALLGIGGIYYSQALKIPLVVSAHTNIPGYLSYYKLRPLEKICWMLMRERHRRSGLNLCTSTVTLTDLQAHGIANLALWERAVDSKRFRPGARTAEMRNRLSNGEPDKRLLLYVGRLSAEKQVNLLRDVLRAIPGTRLAIVGDGPVRADLERHFKDTPTVFTGYLRGEELAAAFASSDLFVFPSETETLGLVLLEAMASECPVVACRAGGIPDAVQDGSTGFLFDPGDPGALVNTVKRALASGPDLDAIRTRAREDTECHSWEGATEQLSQLYQAAIQNWPNRWRPQPPGLVKRVASRNTMALLRTFLP